MEILSFFIIILIMTQKMIAFEESVEGQCSIEEQTKCDGPAPVNEGSRKYGKAYNEILAKVEEAVRKYKPCTTTPADPECECHAEVIEEDLASFARSGITRQMLEEAAKYGTRYKIFQHRLYRDTNCMFPARCQGIEHFLLRLLPRLPDMDLVVNTRDWPQVPKRFSGPNKAVFSFSKTRDDYLDIMYPAWTFWAGGPAISLHPTGIGRWDLLRENISKASEAIAWEAKDGRGFFRGSRTSDERDSLILLSRREPSLVDAKYTKNQGWKSPKDTLGADAAKEVSFEKHCQYKYLFNFRGIAASFRFKHLFLCKSLVFHVGNEWLEFFYPALQPWVHYVPVKSYPSEEELVNILQFFKDHDELAKEIAVRGHDFIWEHLRMYDVECYWEKLLLNYAKLLKFKVREDKDLVEIKIEKK